MFGEKGGPPGKGKTYGEGPPEYKRQVNQGPEYSIGVHVPQAGVRVGDRIVAERLRKACGFRATINGKILKSAKVVRGLSQTQNQQVTESSEAQIKAPADLFDRPGPGYCCRVKGVI
jgi:hypothetical protein